MRRSRGAEAQSRAARGKQAGTALADDLQRPGDGVTNGVGTIVGSGRKRASKPESAGGGGTSQQGTI